MSPFSTNTRLESYLDLQKRMLQTLNGDSLFASLGRSGLPSQAQIVLYGLGVRQIRFLNSVMQLGMNLQAEQATVLSRSIFETTLIVGFITKPGWCLKIKSSNYNKWFNTKRTKDIWLRPTYEERADLYAAHVVNQNKRRVSFCKDTHGLKHIGKAHEKLGNRRVEDASELRVSKVWRFVMKSSKSFCGMNTEGLAKSLGPDFRRWYAAFYGKQSEAVHSVDFDKFLDLSPNMTMTPLWHSGEMQTAAVMHTAMTMFLTFMLVIDKWHDIGIAMRTALSSHSDELLQLSAS